jgi:hypothetical protein
MDQDERSEARSCAACGATLEGDGDRAFEFGDENLLCFECAVARGGRYDESRDAWEPGPDLRGLGDEAYGASPHEQRRRR